MENVNKVRSEDSKKPINNISMQPSASSHENDKINEDQHVSIDLKSKDKSKESDVNKKSDANKTDQKSNQSEPQQATNKEQTTNAWNLSDEIKFNLSDDDSCDISVSKDDLSREFLNNWNMDISDSRLNELEGSNFKNQGISYLEFLTLLICFTYLRNKNVHD